jgi:hypothetical protein
MNSFRSLQKHPIDQRATNEERFLRLSGHCLYSQSSRKRYAARRSRGIRVFPATRHWRSSSISGTFIPSWHPSPEARYAEQSSFDEQ